MNTLNLLYLGGTLEDPDVFFGVQGERTDEQKARVQQFRQEWGNVRGAAAVNGLVNGTYTADQLSQNWGAENLASVIRAETFEVGEFNEGDNFGAYLQSEFDNVSSFINPSGEGVRGTLGTIDTALNQGSGGPKGAERGVTVTAGDLASSSYMTAVRSAAETAGIDIYVDGPAGGQYELNVGQYDDVPLGSYHTVREADSPLEMIFEAVLKAVVVNVLTAGLGADLASLGEALSSSGATCYDGEHAATGANVAYETTEWARNVGDILTGIGQTLEAGGAISAGTGAAASGGIPPYVMTLIKNTASNEGVISDVIEVVDVINTAASAVESEEVPEDIIVDDVAADLEAEQAAAAEEAYRLEQQEAARVAAEQEAARIAEAEAERQRVAEEEAEATRLAEEKAEAARVAAEAEAERQRVAAEEAEAARVAAEEAAEEARLAEEAEAERQRVAAEEAEARRVAAAEAEANRVAAEEAAEEARLAEEAEAARVAAEEAEARRVAEAEAEAKRVAEAKAAAEEAARVAAEEAEAARVAAEEAEAAKAAAEAEAQRVAEAESSG